MAYNPQVDTYSRHAIRSPGAQTLKDMYMGESEDSNGYLIA